MKETRSILRSIAELLRSCNHPDKSRWLELRAIALEAEPSNDERIKILDEVRGFIAGMGSLSDLHLVPEDIKQLSQVDANRKLTELIGILDKQLATRGE